jgi:hypothetical protein
MTNSRNTHIQVLNLAGQTYDADRKLVEDAVRNLPLAFENSKADIHDLPICVDQQMLKHGGGDNDDQLSIEKITTDWLEAVHSHIDERLKSIHWVVLIEEGKSLEGGISEQLGWYSPDVKDYFGPLQIMIDKQGKGESQKKLIESLAQRDPVPIVALVMPTIEDESKKCLENSVYSELLTPNMAQSAEHMQRQWLTIKVLRHELGHHVFPLDVDQKDYDKYRNPDLEISQPVVQWAEGGANLFSWLLGSDADRKVLNIFSKAQDDSLKSRRGAHGYESYKCFLEWADKEYFEGQCSFSFGYGSAIDSLFRADFGGLINASSICQRLAAIEEAFNRAPIWVRSHRNGVDFEKILAVRRSNCEARKILNDIHAS